MIDFPFVVDFGSRFKTFCSSFAVAPSKSREVLVMYRKRVSKKNEDGNLRPTCALTLKMQVGTDGERSLAAW